MLLASGAYASQACLACRRQDINAGFMVQFSFCKTSDECVQDVWNYFNRNCTSDWIRAKQLTLEDCEAKAVTCLDFEVDDTKVAQYFNRTWTLPAQSYCTIKVDATREPKVARVVFDNTSFLGVELQDYQIGDPITVEDEVQEITIYNGADQGQLTFIISFSGAFSVFSSALLTASAAAALLLF